MNKDALLACFLGQVLSLCITSSGAITEYIFRKYELNLCGIQTLSFYSLLACVYLMKWYSSKKNNILATIKLKGKVHSIYSLIDCISSVLLIKAYSYTTLSIIGLLSTVSTPCVIFLSYFFLKSRYRVQQYAGAVVCLVGIIYLFVSLGLDSGSTPWLGGFLAILSAVLYSCGNILAEKLISSSETYKSDEFLALIGGAGVVWSLLFLLMFRTNEIYELQSQPLSVYICILAYSICLLLFYSVFPLFLELASATLFNLSLFTVNIYSALINHFLFDDHFSWSFPVAFFIVSIGILLYTF